MQCYLGIQKFRFNFNIETIVELDEEVRHLRTPKLILQPIVENAIIHAFGDMESGGSIRITCSKAPGNLIWFEVADNGKGMDPVVAGSLLTDQAPDEEKPGGIGLANVDERIKLICGKMYGIEIQSEPGTGTTIRIKLPLMTDDIRGNC
ncbi:Sensor histidine kinase YpdA [compost metagenome]